jgi:hypothetical protein
MKKFTKILCCFNSCSAISLKIIIIILSSIGILISIIGFIVIPWRYTANIIAAFYIISFVLFIYSLVVSIIFLYLQLSKKMNNPRSSFIFSIIVIFGSFISIFLYLFIAIGAIPDLKNKKEIKEVIESNGTVNVYEHRLVSNNKVTIDLFLILINLFIWIILLFLWISVSIRFKYNINCSYNDYLDKIKDLEKENPRLCGFTLVGHDKYGMPVYGKRDRDKIKISTTQNQSNFKSIEKYNKYDMETNGILRYSYKEKSPSFYKKPNYKSVDVNYKYKTEKMEKYNEKYINGTDIVNPYYSNFENKTELNRSSFNNSINPGY